MKKTLSNFLLNGLLIALTVCFYNTGIFAQWSSDPATNLQVCDTTGDQALPKVASLPDGGCYISWFDNRDGNYAVYLQRLDPLGNKMWDNNGLLISNNAQNSSLVDYAIGIDDHNNAIVTFTDIRDNDSLHAFAYLIDTSGTFLWGANGVRLSGNGDYQPNPVVTQTSDGNYVFAWIVATDTQKIALQKISLAGTKMWGTDPIIYASGTAENYSNPKIVASDNGSIVLVHQGYTGPFFAAVVHLYAQKFDTDGNTVWGAGGVVIQDLGTIPFYDIPLAVSDDNNGVFVEWYDDRDNNSLFSSFVQHVTSTGTLLFPANGTEVSTNSSMHHLNPTLAYNSSTDELFSFWLEETPLQDNFAVYGQKFDASGTRQWTDNGKSFTTLSSNALFGPYSQAADTSVYVFYLQGNPSGVNQSVNAFMVNSDGNFSWTPNITDVSDPTPNKLHTVTTISNDNIAKIIWEDTRNDGGGIYAQNVNPNGALGNIILPVELTSFAATAQGNSVNLKWNTATEINNRGFDIERKAISDNSNQSSWEKIGFVSGFGNSTEPKSYSYNDNQLTSGNYSYRLKQVDYNGSFKYSNEIEVTINVPVQFTLDQNYPNPFNPSTKIKFSIPQNGLVTLSVYNTLGQKVADLINGNLTQGEHQINFDASKLTSGIYYYRLESNNNVSVKKMILLK